MFVDTEMRDWLTNTAGGEQRERLPRQRCLDTCWVRAHAHRDGYVQVICCRARESA